MTKRKAKAPQYAIDTGSVYNALDYSDADEMQIKAQLVTKIAEILDRKGLTQIEAAALLGLTQPKLSKLLRGGFRGVSERRLLDCLTRLGRDVQIVVKEPARSKEHGKLTVVFA
jgi:predicted XRE-type DNA-binding protein